MTDDLVAFLRARIAEDEQLADAARRETANDRDECEWYRSGSEGIYTKDTNNGFLQGGYGYLDEAIGDHVVQQQPRRVLRGVEAKRRILDEHMPTLSTVEWPHDQTGKGEALVCRRCQNAENDSESWHPAVGKAGVFPHDNFVTSYVLAPCVTLRLLASE